MLTNILYYDTIKQKMKNALLKQVMLFIPILSSCYCLVRFLITENAILAGFALFFFMLHQSEINK